MVDFGVERVMIDAAESGSTVGSTAQPVWPGKSFLDHSRLSRTVPLVPTRSIFKV